MIKTLLKRPLLATAGVAAMVAAMPEMTWGGDSLFSRVRTEGGTFSAEQARVSDKVGVDLSEVPGDQASSGLAVFDISMSIHDAPAGDDDASADPGAADDEQNAYETMLKHFADAVCEQTNGTHKIGRVNIFKNFQLKSAVDVVWDDSGRPGAHTTGFGKAGWQIFMYDNFGSIKMSDGGDDLQRMGYILGHEWGHYTLGVYDEYVEAGRDVGVRPSQPLSSDVAVDQAIMNSGRRAVGGDYEWLNHSTSNNIGDVTKTAQGRVYGKSGWDTLIQTTNNDPTTVDAWNKPERTHYTNLVGKQPTAADNWYKIELPANQADCRSELDIQWVSNLELDIVIDRSGSMAGTRIANAKSAASSLVDLLVENEMAAGVTTFETGVQNVAGITPITSAADKTTLKNAISAITTAGVTSLWDGAVFGLNKLTTYASTNNTSAAQLVFVLSDGGDNDSSETLASASAKFQAAGVPVIAFGYGGASDPNMPALAANTGGLFFNSPTTAPDIQAAFSAAFAETSGAVGLASSQIDAADATTETVEFVIDDTIASISAVLGWNGAQADFNVSLLDSTGADTGESFTCTEASGAVNCNLNLDEAAVQALGTGTYTVSAENVAGTNRVVSIQVIGAPIPGVDGGSYSVRLASQGGQTVTYPDPIVISAVISKDLPITGATVVANVTDPGGNVSAIDMNDDGVGADQYAGDGLYSAWAPYTGDGAYNVRVVVTNPGGTASFTTGGLTQAHYASMAQLEPGDNIPLPVLGGQNFQRVGNLQINVVGAIGDDHADDPTVPAGCTAMTPDNTGVAAKTDFAGDPDCFFLAGPLANTDPITVRAFNRALGADPKLKVYASDGATEIATIDPASLPASNGAVFKAIPAADIDTAGMVILAEDSDAAASGGTFSVSAGPALPSDVAIAAAPPASNGGALGPWGVALMALLSFLGFATRRRQA